MLTEEDYLLVCLAEEATEVGHAVAKALRFGLDHVQRFTDATNRDRIRDELRDLFRLAERLGLADFTDLPDKGEKFATMMKLSQALGKLEGPPPLRKCAWLACHCVPAEGRRYCGRHSDMENRT
jgi:NTP pyrophosphatase (non-canonical NTP hydrolase)